MLEGGGLFAAPETTLAGREVALADPEIAVDRGAAVSAPTPTTLLGRELVPGKAKLVLAAPQLVLCGKLRALRLSRVLAVGRESPNHPAHGNQQAKSEHAPRHSARLHRHPSISSPEVARKETV